MHGRREKRTRREANQERSEAMGGRNEMGIKEM